MAFRIAEEELNLELLRLNSSSASLSGHHACAFVCKEVPLDLLLR